MLFPQSVAAAPAQSPADVARWYTFTSANGLAGNIVQAIWEDPHGHLWFGTENGASRYDGHTWTTYRTADGLVDNNVWSISGNAEAVWFATSNGVSVFSNGVWQHYRAQDGLPHNDVRAVLVSTDGTVWVGTFGGGVGRKRPGAAWEIFDLQTRGSTKNIIVQAIAQSPAGEIWFATNGAGVFRVTDERLEKFGFREVARNTVWGIGPDPRTGLTWLATFRGIATVQGDDRVTIITDLVQTLAISETEVLAVAASARAGTWFGTRAHGVFHLDDRRWERFTAEQGLSRDYVQSILVDHADRVWFGTRGGGVTLLEQQPQSPNMTSLHAEITVRNIEDNTPLVLHDAVLRWNQNNLICHFVAPVAWVPSQHVSFQYWLRSGHSNASTPTVVQSAAGAAAQATSEAWVDLPPGDYALHVVPLVDGVAGAEDVYRFKIESAPPSFRANALKTEVNGQPMVSGSRLPETMFEVDRVVEVALAATDDATPAENLRYQYRVSGSAAVWQTVEGNRVRVRLPQGTHAIEVQAVDGDGNVSTPTSVTVIVPGPLWMTLVFYLGLIVVPTLTGGVAGAWGYRRWAQRQALRRAVAGHLIPYDVGSPITAPERYIGRQHIIDTILGSIDHNSFYVYGEKRIGKTSLLIQLKQRLQQRNRLQTTKLYVPVFFNIQDLPQAQFWRALIRGLADKAEDESSLLLSAGRQAVDYQDLDAEDDFETIVASLKRQQPERRPLVVLLLDEVDTLQRYDPVIRQRFRAFAQALQEHLQVVLAGVLPPRAQPSDTSPWYNIFVPLRLGPLEESAARFLIRNYNDNPYAYTPDAEQTLLVAGDGKPFDTQWLCSEAVKAMLAHKRTTIIPADAEHAIRVVVGERSREYAAFWDSLGPVIQADILAALQNGGYLVPDRVALGAHDLLVEGGVARNTPRGHRLAHLFQMWLEASV